MQSLGSNEKKINISLPTDQLPRPHEDNIVSLNASRDLH